MTATKRMVIVVSNKGGVGKTTFASSLIDQLKSNNIQVSAWDADGGVGGLLRAAGQRGDDGKLLGVQDPTVGVGYYDIRREDERAGMINCVSAGHDLIIQDMAGGSLLDAARVVDGGDIPMLGFLDALDRHGYTLSVAHVLSVMIGATTSVGMWLDAIPPDRADHVAVLNMAFGRTPADFPYWMGHTDGRGARKGGGNRRRLMEAGGVEMAMPALPSATFAKLDALNLLPNAAMSSPDLTVAEQAHCARFCRDFTAQLAIAGNRLGWSG